MDSDKWLSDSENLVIATKAFIGLKRKSYHGDDTQSGLQHCDAFLGAHLTNQTLKSSYFVPQIWCRLKINSSLPSVYFVTNLGNSSLLKLSNE